MNKKGFKNIICISLFLNLFFVSSFNTASADFKETAKNATKSVAQCATSFGASWAVGKVTGLINGLLGTEVTTHDTTLENYNVLESCMRGIAIRISKEELKSLTDKTINWIKGGLNNETNPLLVSSLSVLLDSASNSILESEISIFKSLESETSFPYGRDYARSIDNQIKAKDGGMSNLKSDLSDYLVEGSNTSDFAQDFSVGGWDGWLALTQHDQNNPLGFTMRAQQEIANKQQAKTEQIKTESDQGNGMLPQRSQTDCARWQKDPELVLLSGKMAKMELEANKACYENQSGETCRSLSSLTDSLSKQYQTVVKAKSANNNDEICSEYKIVTPGSIIKDQLASIINDPQVQLESVRTLDDILYMLFDKFMDRFQKNGIAGSTLEGTTSGGLAFGSGDIGTSATGSFNLKDLGDIIKIQENYTSLIKKLFTSFDGVMPALGELDYCIPGPNPSWQEYVIPKMEKFTWAANLESGQERIDIGKDAVSLLTRYSDAYEKEYGTKSPMQDPVNGGSAYLPMAGAGIALTTGMNSTASNIETARDGYKTFYSQANKNIPKLKQIAKEYNSIILTAQRRRDAESSKNGLPVASKACLASELIQLD